MIIIIGNLLGKVSLKKKTTKLIDTYIAVYYSFFISWVEPQLISLKAGDI